MKSAAKCGAALAAALLVAGLASAAPGLSEAQLRYHHERAACLNGSSHQDRATCLKEAGAALHEARRDGLATAADDRLAQNRLTRCQAVPLQDREDCALRMSHGTTSGSAQQGGILREHERAVPAR